MIILRGGRVDPILSAGRGVSLRRAGELYVCAERLGRSYRVGRVAERVADRGQGSGNVEARLGIRVTTVGGCISMVEHNWRGGVKHLQAKPIVRLASRCRR